MQKRLFWEFLGMLGTRTLGLSEKANHKPPAAAGPPADLQAAFWLSAAAIVASASFVRHSLVVLVIAFAMPFGYTCPCKKQRRATKYGGNQELVCSD